MREQGFHEEVNGPKRLETPNKEILTYHLEYSDYSPHLYFYTNVLAGMSFGFFKYFMSNSEAQTEPRTEPFIQST